MPKVITTLQAMSHPTVVATINCLSEMSQRLKDENEELKAEVAAERPWVGFTDEEREVLWAAGYHHDTILMVEESLKRRNT